jgi:hypothetical protein
LPSVSGTSREDLVMNVNISLALTDLWQRLMSSLLGQHRPFEARHASQDRRKFGVDFSFAVVRAPA